MKSKVNELPRRKQRGIVIENYQSYAAERPGIIPNLLVRRSWTRRRIKTEDKVFIDKIGRLALKNCNL